MTHASATVEALRQLEVVAGEQLRVGEHRVAVVIGASTVAIATAHSRSVANAIGTGSRVAHAVALDSLAALIAAAA